MAVNKNDEVITIDLREYLTPIAILVGAILISASILITGSKFGGSTAGATTTAATTSSTASAAATTITTNMVSSLFDGSYITFGDKNSSNVFVEFSDPSCPYCHVAGGLNPSLNAQIGDRFKLVSDGGTYLAPVEEMRKLVDSGDAAFVWAYSNGHGNGELGTQALYCAYENNKFWEVHDLLMNAEGYSMMNDTVKNDASKASVLADFTASAMDKATMQGCLESGKYADRTSRDQSTAGSFGVSGTPGFVVNTQYFAGAYSWSDMTSYVI